MSTQARTPGFASTPAPATSATRTRTELSREREQKMGFGQVAATSQFYLYGRRYCTATGYAKARAAMLKEGPDLLESADLSLVVTPRT